MKNTLLSSAFGSVVDPMMEQFKGMIIGFETTGFNPKATGTSRTERAVDVVNAASEVAKIIASDREDSCEDGPQRVGSMALRVSPAALGELEEMQKNQLLAYAERLQVKVAKSWTKAKIIAALSQPA